MKINLSLFHNKTPHFPVLIREIINLVQNNPNIKTVVDCTFGAGGYSRAILEHSAATVIAIDRDQHAARYAQPLKELYPGRFFFNHATFSKIDEVLQRYNLSSVDVVIADLGVSTIQLLSEERGFSLKNDGPLSMSMGINSFNAFDFVNYAKEEEISKVLWEYGEEPKARLIAKHIVNSRNSAPIETTKALKDIIHRALKFTVNKAGKDSATKSFQAIRIHVNNEFTELVNMLNKAIYLINPNGKIAVITFHSIEDRIVKIFFNELSKYDISNNMVNNFTLLKPTKFNTNLTFQIVTKKPITPLEDEIKLNRNSASAKLRIIQRAGGNHE